MTSTVSATAEEIRVGNAIRQAFDAARPQHAREHAEALVFDLAAQGIRARVWQGGGLTRVYIGPAFVEVAAGGTARTAADRGSRATYVPGRGWRAAFAVYCAGLPARLEQQAEAVLATVD
jgi:hypothetical protein